MEGISLDAFMRVPRSDVIAGLGPYMAQLRAATPPELPKSGDLHVDLLDDFQSLFPVDLPRWDAINMQ